MIVARSSLHYNAVISGTDNAVVSNIVGAVVANIDIGVKMVASVRHNYVLITL